MAHSITGGESPYASHLLLTQILDDRLQHERDMGIACGIDMHHRCDAVAFYIDRGWSRGMTAALKHAREIGAVIEHRMLAMTTPVSIEWPTAHFNPPPPPPEPRPIER